VPRYFSRIVLMLGNVVTGLTILGPAGMLAELAEGLHVGIHDTGLLVTYGAVVLFIGSPVMAWLTTRIDRRILLVATLAIMAAGEAASALAPNYNLNLSLRLVVLAVAAIYTPQAAATVALIVTDRERPSAIAFVFLGWSIAIAGGLPLVSLIATHFGWQTVYGVLAILAAAVAALLLVVLPKGLKGRPLSPQSYVTISYNKRIVLILLVTLLQTSGQFTVFIYLAPLLKALTGAGAAVASAFFAFYGVVGLLGNVVASAIVTALGTQKTLALFMASTLFGMAVWAVGAGWLLAMGAGVFFWAFGFSAINSMQQARLVAAAPDLASASVALNTSVLYVGQAIGSGVGGLLYVHEYFHAAGYVGVAFVASACAVLAVTWERDTPHSHHRAR
jgi:MFS transporter, DHA1 family, inner membrane transport protein